MTLPKGILAGAPIERDRSATKTFGVKPEGTGNDQEAMECRGEV